MKWADLDIDTILDAVDKYWTEEEQEDAAFNVVSSLTSNTKELRHIYKQDSVMGYISEYMPTGEYKEWLERTFLSDIEVDKIFIIVYPKELYLSNKRDCKRGGDIVEIIDWDNNIPIGYIRGRLANYELDYIVNIIENKEYENI